MKAQDKILLKIRFCCPFFKKKPYVLEKSHSQILDREIFSKYTETGHPILTILPNFPHSFNFSHLE